MMGSGMLPDWKTSTKWAAYGAASSLTGIAGVNTFGRGSNAAYRKWGEGLAKKSDEGGVRGFAARMGLGVLRAGRTGSYNPALGAKSVKDSFKGGGSSVFTMDGGKGGYLAKLEASNKKLKEQKTEAEQYASDSKVWKEPEKIAKGKDIDETHKASAPSEEVIKEIVSATITGALSSKKNASLLAAHQGEHDEAKDALDVSAMISKHDRETNATAKQAQAQAIMQKTTTGNIEAARQKAIADVARTTKDLTEKLATTQEGVTLLGAATKKATQQVREHHVTSTARAYADKKHNGNLFKAFSEVTEHLKGKTADASNKDVVSALDKLSTK